jgi:raffinose/stachyose/melibiose transport system permease protein
MHTNIESQPNVSIDTQSSPRKKPQMKWNAKTKDSIYAYAMLLPMLIGFSLFTLYPMFWLIRWSFFDYDGITSTFVGIDNFLRTFTRDSNYWWSLLNTFIVTFAKLAIEIPLALVLAIFLNKRTKINAIFRVSFFMPTIVSAAIVGLIFSILFNPINGFVDTLLKDSGAITSPIDWLSNKWLALLILGIAALWQGFGINMIFFLMGLQSIPADLYECADIDGAGRWHKFTKITLPMLAPVMQVIIMLAIISSMKIADLALVLTNGQPGGKSEMVMTYIFKYFFNYGGGESSYQIGYGASLAVVTALIFALITVLFFKLTSKMKQIY